MREWWHESCVHQLFRSGSSLLQRVSAYCPCDGYSLLSLFRANEINMVSLPWIPHIDHFLLRFSHFVLSLLIFLTQVPLSHPLQCSFNFLLLFHFTSSFLSIGNCLFLPFIWIYRVFASMVSLRTWNIVDEIFLFLPVSKPSQGCFLYCNLHDLSPPLSLLLSLQIFCSCVSALWFKGLYLSPQFYPDLLFDPPNWT